MPQFSCQSAQEQVLRVSVALAAVCLIAGCPKPAPPAAPANPVAPPTAVQPPAAGPVSADTAVADPATPPADAPAADGTATADQSPAKPDPSLMPGNGGFAVANVRLGMSLAEVYGRYPAEGNWAYDARFIPNTHTGTVAAKPIDARARATETFILEDGQVVSFARAVKENAAAFGQIAKDLAASYGEPQAKPPTWAYNYDLFRTWHKTANEDARFWDNPQRRTVLTASLSPSGSETIYMLLDLPRLQSAQEAITAAGSTMVPDQAPPQPPGQLPAPTTPAPGQE